MLKRFWRCVLVAAALSLLLVGYHVGRFMRMLEIPAAPLLGMGKEAAIGYCFQMQKPEERQAGKKLMFVDVDPKSLRYWLYYRDPAEAQASKTLMASNNWEVLFEQETFLWV